jgi:hypothetical protein
VNLVLDIRFFFSFIQELHDGVITGLICWFKSLAVVQNKSFVLVLGSKFFVNITLTDFFVRNELKSKIDIIAKVKP